MSTRSSSLLYSPRPIGDSQAVIYRPTAPAGKSPIVEPMKSPYRADQQVKYLHLQAEVESLLQHLQILKKQRLASDFAEAHNQGQ